MVLGGEGHFETGRGDISRRFDSPRGYLAAYYHAAYDQVICVRDSSMWRDRGELKNDSPNHLGIAGDSGNLRLQ